mmetsp:Transcript_12576/g.18794  ORF Transcript_12576/g.18794 Transcript_12576/m.18794 type:complete len:102 (+) Transcript_12576:1056-1361(+)
MSSFFRIKTHILPNDAGRNPTHVRSSFGGGFMAYVDQDTQKALTEPLSNQRISHQTTQERKKKATHFSFFWYLVAFKRRTRLCWKEYIDKILRASRQALSF